MEQKIKSRRKAGQAGLITTLRQSSRRISQLRRKAEECLLLLRASCQGNTKQPDAESRLVSCTLNGENLTFYFGGDVQSDTYEVVGNVQVLPQRLPKAMEESLSRYYTSQKR